MPDVDERCLASIHGELPTSVVVRWPGSVMHKLGEGEAG